MTLTSRASRGARKRKHAEADQAAAIVGGGACCGELEHLFDMACGHGLLGVLLVRAPRC
jgi:hypothetical protein